MEATDAENTELPVFRVDPESHDLGCESAPDCLKIAGNIYKRLVGSYLGIEEVFEKQVKVAQIDLDGLTYNDYLARVKKRYKGNVIRDARKSDKAGFECRPFVRKLHLPDLVSINHSKENRSGRPMRDSYLKTLKELGGPPTKQLELTPPSCPKHYDLWWGVFAPEPGHKQGEIVTNERLIAYIDFRRIGQLGIYSLILGHGDYLGYGIMYRLHFEIMEWLCRRDNAETKGLRTLMYAGFYQGQAGLQLWKKKTAFAPGYIIVPAPSEAIKKYLGQ